MNTFTVFSDPGHAWAQVPMTLLDTLGITAKITPYSYKKDGFAYLEEDVDLYIFAQAFKAWYGAAPTFVDRYTSRNSRIRNYPQFTP